MKRNTGLFFCFLIMFTVSSYGIAQSSSNGIQNKTDLEKQIVFEHISLEQGLSQSIVRCVMQDSRGFLWFGTEDGLNRYDGFRFKVYQKHPFDSTTISDANMRDIYESPGEPEFLWVATRCGGLNRLDRKTEKFTHDKNIPGESTSINHNWVHHIYEDSQRNFWVFTEDGGIDRLNRDTGKFTRFRHDPAFKTHHIYPEKVPEIEIYIKNKIDDGHYSTTSNLADLTKALRKDFRYGTNDRHIWIDIMENLLLKDKDVSIEEIANRERVNNFGFVEFKIFDGNVAYLRLDGFRDMAYAKETASYAMGMPANSEAIILNLRENHGGHGNMVHFISSYFFKEKVQLNSLYFREADSLVHDWTDPLIPGQKLFNQKLYILTSINTTSAAESFVYS